MDGIENTPTASGISPEAHASALNAARTEALAEGRKAGATDATARIRSILTADAAKGREATAMSFALDTSMSADEAIKALGTVPAAAAATPSIPSIQQRSAAMPEMGGSEPVKTSRAEIKGSWAKAFGPTAR